MFRYLPGMLFTVACLMPAVPQAGQPQPGGTPSQPGRVTIQNGGKVTVGGTHVTMRLAPGMTVETAPESSFNNAGGAQIRWIERTSQIPPSPAPPQEPTTYLPILIGFLIVLILMAWMFTRYRFVKR